MKISFADRILLSKSRKLIAVFSVLFFACTVLFTNCYNVALLPRITESSQASQVNEPEAAPAPEPAPFSSPEVSPTVTESQCDAYHASNPIYQEGQQPAIFFLCDKLLSSVNGGISRKIDLALSPDIYLDLTHHFYQATRLHKRIQSGDASVQGLSVNWWASANAPPFVTNPADPLSRIIKIPSNTGEKFSLYFQVLKGSEAGLVHQVNITVLAVNNIQAIQNVSCPGFAATLNILPYTNLVTDEYFTASHGFIDSSTAMVMPFKVPAGSTGGRISYFNPYSEPWIQDVNISTRPCDFSSNVGTVFHGGGFEFDYYTGSFPTMAGQYISGFDTQYYRNLFRLDPDKVYYINMRVPSCPQTADGKQHNCFAIIKFSSSGGSSATSVDEFRGVYYENGMQRTPLFPSYTSPGIQLAR